MKSSLGAITAKHRRRFEILANEIGCIACRLIPAEIHHLISGGRRISHDHTIPLCGNCHTGTDSTHKRKKWFAGEYGTDDKLLERTNDRLAEFESRVIG